MQTADCECGKIQSFAIHEGKTPLANSSTSKIFHEGDLVYARQVFLIRRPQAAALLLRIFDILGRFTFLPIFDNLDYDCFEFVITTRFNEESLNGPGIGINHMFLLS